MIAPCNSFKAKSFLQHNYMVEAFRQNYIEKELEKLCAEEAFGEPKIETVPAGSNLPAVITRGGNKLNVKNNIQISKPQFCSQGNHETRVEEINSQTTTLYTGKPSLILPSDQYGNQKKLEFNTSDESQYLHIILPTSELNILNSAGAKVQTEDSENMFVEIGCKIFEINHIGSYAEQ